MSIDQAIAESFQTYHAYNPRLDFKDRPLLYRLKSWITNLLYQSTEAKARCHACYTDPCHVLKMCACGLSTYCGNCLFNLIAFKITSYDDIINTMRSMCPACKTGHPEPFYEALQNENAAFLNDIHYYEVANFDLATVIGSYTNQGLHLEYDTREHNQLTVYIGLVPTPYLTNKIKIKTATITAEVFNTVYYKATEFYIYNRNRYRHKTTTFNWNRMCQFINRELELNERNVFLDYYLIKVLMYNIRSYSIH